MLKFPVLPSRDITPEDLKGCQGFSGETRVFFVFFFSKVRGTVDFVVVRDHKICLLQMLGLLYFA